MATRGKRRKPAALSIVGGTGDETPPEIPKREGVIEPPKKLTIPQQRIWDKYIEPAWWLSQGDALLCYIFVNLMVEYIQKPKLMVASRIGELRKSMAELHLTSSEQARLGVGAGVPDPAAEFFK